VSNDRAVRAVIDRAVRAIVDDIARVVEWRRRVPPRATSRRHVATRARPTLAVHRRATSREGTTDSQRVAPSTWRRRSQGRRARRSPLPR
jgi:hypothetical protein